MPIHIALQHYISIIRQRIAFILAGVALCTGATLLLSTYLPPVYQATTLIKVNTTTAIAGPNDVYSAQAAALDYALLVTDPEVLQEATKKLPGTSLNQLQQAISASPVDNTQVIEVRAQANTAQRAAEAANIVTNIFIQTQTQNEILRLQTTSNQLNPRIAAAKLDLDTAQRNLIDLQNNHAPLESISQQKSIVDTYQANYNQLLSSFSQLQLQKVEALNILTVTQKALPPQQSISPHLLPNVLLAAALSSLFMLLLSLLLDWLDISIKTADDVMHLCKMEPLASIPAISAKAQLQLTNMRKENNQGSVWDAYTILGTRVRALIHTPQTLVVTSVRTGAGNTTTASHLAILLSQMGLRVLLVDGNLKRPTLHETFQQTNGKGVVNGLEYTWHFNDKSGNVVQWLAQWRTSHANLWLLPAGPTIARTTPILQLTEMLRQAKLWLLGEKTGQRIIDLIIIDSAALDNEGTALPFVQLADAAIIVVEAGREHKESLQQVDTLLARLNIARLGVVITQQKQKHHSYFYTETMTKKEKALNLEKRTAKHGSITATGLHTRLHLPLPNLKDKNAAIRPDILHPGKKPIAPEQDQSNTSGTISAAISADPIKATSNELPTRSIGPRLILPASNDRSVRHMHPFMSHSPLPGLNTDNYALLHLPTEHSYSNSRDTHESDAPLTQELETPSPIPISILDTEIEEQGKNTRQIPRLQFKPILRKKLTGSFGQGREQLM